MSAHVVVHSSQKLRMDDEYENEFEPLPAQDLMLPDTAMDMFWMQNPPLKWFLYSGFRVDGTIANMSIIWGSF